MNSEIMKWLDSGKSWVLEAGTIIKMRLSEKITIHTKSNINDLVTNIDNEIEQLFRKKIGHLNHHQLFGEEGDTVSSSDGYIWILDPVDGTTNLVTTGRDFVISLALYHHGSPFFGIVYDVMRDELYHAITGNGAYINDKPLAMVQASLPLNEHVIICDIKEILSYPRVAELIKLSRGHRRYGSAALEIIHVATGRAGAFIHMMVHPWDIAAAKIIAEECGAQYTRTDGTLVNVFEKGSSLVAPNLIHQEILSLCFS